MDIDIRMGRVIGLGLVLRTVGSMLRPPGKVLVGIRRFHGGVEVRQPLGDEWIWLLDMNTTCCISGVREVQGCLIIYYCSQSMDMNVGGKQNGG
ncbi:MAG: hypothetical protein JRJ85_17655 [Deltaproteobacteria bacterium]|nr:hypothetical protein [Deltaproteobacteria bacterium]